MEALKAVGGSCMTKSEFGGNGGWGLSQYSRKSLAAGSLKVRGVLLTRSCVDRRGFIEEATVGSPANVGQKTECSEQHL